MTFLVLVLVAKQNRQKGALSVEVIDNGVKNIVGRFAPVAAQSAWPSVGSKMEKIVYSFSVRRDRLFFLTLMRFRSRCNAGVECASQKLFVKM